MSRLREACRGAAGPLTARLEPWQLALLGEPDVLAAWVDRHGSPLNLIDPSPIARNAGELMCAATDAGVELKIFFARKANKALALVDEARRLRFGVDVASERELRQALDRGVRPAEIVVTAAVKPRALLELCVAHRPTVVIDNEDELELLLELAGLAERDVPVALRLAPELAPGRPQTRFGLGGSELLALADRRIAAGARLAIDGIHFHLDGYAAAERVTAISASFGLIDGLRARGHQPTFIDIGGGIPMSYLDDPQQWSNFWREQRAAVRGERPPLTFESLGLSASDVYPYYQQPVRGAWLEQVLRATAADGTPVAQGLRERGLALRCEPGRSLLDGCGMTAARVEFRKRRRDGTWLIGLAMNRTQCRSTSADFLVDPILVRPSGQAAGACDAIEGFLVGAYCIERELLTWRRLSFPHGVQVGDIVVFPNTAGYLMHILESSSHQMPLARNLILGAGRAPQLDPIDQGSAKQ